jgi:putative methyltransferase (TIGR04325 family)
MRRFLGQFVRKLFGVKPDVPPPRYGYSGRFQSWAEASSGTLGYQDPKIATKVAHGAREVRTGKAVYERDSVTFSRRQYSFPVATALLWAGCKNNGKLHVLDFGGGFGTSFVQNQPFLGALEHVNWTIVEQPTFVAEARHVLGDAGLIFESDLGESLRRGKPDLALISSSLQYVERPFEILGQLIESEVEMIVLDRTLFSDEADDLVTKQRVPEEIFPATIPVWIFSEAKFTTFMAAKYTLISRFASSQTTVDWDSEGRKLEELGFIYVLRGSAYDSLSESTPYFLEKPND